MKTDVITKEELDAKVREMTEAMTPEEVAARAAIYGHYSKKLRDSAKDALLSKSDWDKSRWRGIEISRKSGAGTYKYSDKELAELQEKAKKLSAEIKARQSFLKDMDEYEYTPGTDTVVVKIPS